MRVSLARIVAQARRRLNLREDERGVTLVFVALCIVAIFGMVVLVIDVGGLLVERRAMVKGADSAALAAAQSCASGQPGDAESQSDYYADANVGGTPAGGIIESKNCGTSGLGHVTVRYSIQQPLYFARVLGFGGSQVVRAKATAAWAAAGAANPLPIVLNQTTFQGDCDIPDVAENTKCFLWYDNDRFEGSNFGFLALDQWDVPSTYNCSSAGGTGQLNDWISGDWSGDPLPLNYPDPTYVCSTSGNRDTSWSNTLSGRIGDILVFPINDQSGQITGPSGQVLLYDIIGFASMKLVAVLDANEARADSGSCDKMNDFSTGEQLNLNSFGIAQGCFNAAPDNVTLNRLYSKKQTFVNGTDYTYDALTRTITWRTTPTNQVHVDFDWSFTGPCGTPPSNESSHCIIVEWVGYHYGGSDPGGGKDFGLTGIRLCDPEISGSCPEGT